MSSAAVVIGALRIEEEIAANQLISVEQQVSMTGAEICSFKSGRDEAKVFFLP